MVPVLMNKAEIQNCLPGTKLPSKSVKIVLLVFIIFLTFFPVIEADYLAYDEQTEILAGPLINQPINLNALWQIFSSVEKGANQYTPLSVASFWLEFNLFGQNSAVSHLINLLLHCFAAVAVYCLLLQLLEKASMAWFAAALWAVHPFQVQSVAWVLERRNLLYGMFLFASFAVYALSNQNKKKLLVHVATIFMLLSGLAKTLAFFAPVVWLMIDLVAGRRDFARMFREKTPAFVLGLILMIVMFKAASGGISSQAGGLLDWNLATFAMSFYVYKTLWPVELLPVYEVSSTSEAMLTSGPVFFAVTALLLAIVSRKNFLGLAGSLFYFMHIFPLSGLIRVGKRFYAAGHFMYVAVFGLILVLISLIDRPERQNRFNWPEVVLACAVLLSLAGVSYSHCHIWKDTVSLYEYVLAADPDSEFSRRNLAVFYLGKFDYQNAARHFSELVRRHPQNKQYLHSYAASLVNTGETAKAYKYFEEYVRRFPDCASGYKGKAFFLMQQDKQLEAIENYSLAIDSANHTHDLFKDRAAARIICSDYPGAIDDLNTFLAKEKDDLNALMMLTEASRRLGKYGVAIAAATRIVELRPDFVVFRKMLFELYCEALDYSNASIYLAEILVHLAAQPEKFLANIKQLFWSASFKSLLPIVPYRGLLYHWFRWTPFNEE